MGEQRKQRRPRRRFTPEFKAEVVEFCRQQGNTVAQAAKDFDINESNLRSWIRQADIDNGRRDGLTTAEREEIAQVRKENKVLREERDILKRATAFFARETR